MKKRLTASTMERVAVLKNVSLFQGLAFEHLVVIARACTAVRSEPGKTVMLEGETPDALFVVMDGRVQVYRGPAESPTVLAELGPFDLFGEMALFDSSPRSASVRTLLPSIFLRLARDDFEEVVYYHPAVALDAVRLLSLRMRALNERLSEVQSRQGSAP